MPFILLNVNLLNAILLIAILLNDILLNVVAPTTTQKVVSFCDSIKILALNLFVDIHFSNSDQT
jgi:hypothetical protein